MLQWQPMIADQIHQYLPLGNEWRLSTSIPEVLSATAKFWAFSWESTLNASQHFQEKNPEAAPNERIEANDLEKKKRPFRFLWKGGGP